MDSTALAPKAHAGRSRLLVTVGVVIALVAGLLLTASPAQAAYSVTFAPTGGAVGTQIALTSSVSSGATGVGIGTVTYYAAGKAVATAKVDAVGAVAAASWRPTTAGSVPMYAAYASADGSQAATSAVWTVTITAAATTTDLTMPATAKVGSTVTITATVTVTSGSYLPTGSVTFLLPSDVVLTAASLNAKGVATISVRMPDKASTYQLTAKYNGDTNAEPSTSKAGSTLVTDNGSNVALSVSPATVTVGATATLTAAITPSNSAGSVTFYAGSTVLGSTTVTNGKATLGWKPATAATVILTASFFPKGASKATGTDSLTVKVVGSRPLDTITLAPTGQAPWPAGSTHVMRYRTQTTFTASARSGGAVTVSAAGACVMSGLTVTANAGSGTCTLTARSPGSASLAATSQNYAIVLARGIQTANLTPPASQRLRKGRYYWLGSANTVTNAGALVTWRVSYGSSRCKITRRADGSYQLRAKRLGRCTVHAFAPPVDGTWLRFSKYYKYRVTR